MKTTCKLCVLALCLGAVACGDSDENNEPGDKKIPLTCDEVTRTQTADALDPSKADDQGALTLSGTYSVTGRVIFDSGEKVTISPGTVFLMAPDSHIIFGWRNDPATVNAKGTAEAPILFCGTAKKQGHWKDVAFLGGTTSDSTLEHVRVEDGGGSESQTSTTAAFVATIAMDIKHLTITNSSRAGAELYALGAGSSNFTITGNALNPVDLYGVSAINNLPAGEYTGNGEDVARVKGYGNTTVVFTDRGVPYRQLEDRIVFGPAGGDLTSITFNAGVTYQFCQDCFMLIGWRNDPGAIYSRGTAEAPVTLTSSQANPMPGDWGGVSLLGGTKSDSVITYTNFMYGGQDDGANLIISGGKGSVSNNTFSNSAGAGMLIQSKPESGLSFEGNMYMSNGTGDLVDETAE